MSVLDVIVAGAGPAGSIAALTPGARRRARAPRRSRDVSARQTVRRHAQPGRARTARVARVDRRTARRRTTAGWHAVERPARQCAHVVRIRRRGTRRDAAGPRRLAARAGDPRRRPVRGRPGRTRAADGRAGRAPRCARPGAGLVRPPRPHFANARDARHRRRRWSIDARARAGAAWHAARPRRWALARTRPRGLRRARLARCTSAERTISASRR